MAPSRFLLVQLENAQEGTPDDGMNSDENIGKVQEENRRSSGKTKLKFFRVISYRYVTISFH